MTAFDDPVYPLSLGRVDELIDIIAIEEIELEKGEPIFSGTAIPGDIREMKFTLPDFKKGQAPVKLEPAVVETVPLRFKVEKGTRLPIKKATITFLPYSLKIEVKDFEREVFKLMVKISHG